MLLQDKSDQEMTMLLQTSGQAASSPPCEADFLFWLLQIPMRELLALCRVHCCSGRGGGGGGSNLLGPGQTGVPGLASGGVKGVLEHLRKACHMR